MPRAAVDFATTLVEVTLLDRSLARQTAANRDSYLTFLVAPNEIDEYYYL